MVESFLIVILFILGLMAGSFLNVIILRLPKKQSILGLSYCPYCKKTLKTRDLIPVLSFILQGGKCRSCQKPISLQYPFVELSTGIIFALIAFKFLFPITASSILATFYFLTIASFLIIIFVYDLKYMTIPDKIIYPAAGLAVVFWLTSLFIIKSPLALFDPVLSPLLGVLISGGFFLILALLSKEKWMGFGDVKLGALLGIFLGFPLILATLALAFISGAGAGLILMAAKKKKRTDQIPFGPFLVAATIIILLWGSQILAWYLQTLGVGI